MGCHGNHRHASSHSASYQHPSQTQVLFLSFVWVWGCGAGVMKPGLGKAGVVPGSLSSESCATHPQPKSQGLQGGQEGAWQEPASTPPTQPPRLSFSPQLARSLLGLLTHHLFIHSLVHSFMRSYTCCTPGMTLGTGTLTAKAAVLHRGNRTAYGTGSGCPRGCVRVIPANRPHEMLVRGSARRWLLVGQGGSRDEPQ